jgi:hypothetical protein
MVVLFYKHLTSLIRTGLLIKKQIEFLIMRTESATAIIQSSVSPVRPIYNLTEFREIAMAMNITIMIFWNVTPCSLIDRYIRFRRT